MKNPIKLFYTLKYIEKYESYIKSKRVFLAICLILTNLLGGLLYGYALGTIGGAFISASQAFFPSNTSSSPVTTNTSSSSLSTFELLSLNNSLRREDSYGYNNDWISKGQWTNLECLLSVATYAMSLGKMVDYHHFGHCMQIKTTSLYDSRDLSSNNSLNGNATKTATNSSFNLDTTILQGLFASSIFIGGLFGCLFAMFTGSVLGRKLSIILSCLISIIGSIGAAASYQYSTLIVFRCILGLEGGSSLQSTSSRRNTTTGRSSSPSSSSSSSSSSTSVRRDYKPLTLLEPPVALSHSEEESNDFIHHREEENKNQHFFSFHLEPELVRGLQENNITTPSSIQELAIAQLLHRRNRKKNFCIGAQTGTGKTLSYLLPLLKKMKHLESVKGMETQIKKPKFLIVAPTRELATQIHKTAKYLSHYMKFRAVLLRSDMSKARMKRDLSSKCDLVVTTPQIFSKMHGDGHVYFSDIRFVVLDEADTLCAKDFLPDLEKIVVPCIERGKYVKEFVQFGFVFATYNANVERFLKHYFGESEAASLAESVTASDETTERVEDSKILYLIDKDMHKTQSHIKQRFITLNANNQDKLKYLVERVLKIRTKLPTKQKTEEDSSATPSIKNQALLESLSELDDNDTYFTNKVQIVNFGPKITSNTEKDNTNRSAPERVLIFCNTVKSCRAVHHSITEAGLEAACFHGEMMAPKQAEEFDAFSTGRVRVMVTTDIAARGLDLVSPVDHVVLFDFPLNSIDYMHRVGRTGRMGADGRVTCLLNRKMETELAKAIQYAMVTNQPLTTINVENASENLERMKGEQARKRQLRRNSYEKRFRNSRSDNNNYYQKGPISINNPNRMSKLSNKKNY
ncbi:ATP-dependent RNA helicase [Naegleria gruberi]|uniref:ATP-dependent RNA helicase n=1 Tax=Naegleria gruberi TaxID=5762 RepID=D2UZ55_NAEGR|nr:ATP-dependent RNA helicase [Naegleria gruberi]EFC50095.1 ATP-dependent RNA helicase [Naegleria gruberi]|eukprot:XP_002682839.1 ATP-dependent RNA helicase [Naegleria gruberi strain NEG-M]